MRVSFFAAVGMLLLALSPASAETWVKFTDPNGQFSVMFPYAPMVITKTLKSDGGATLPMVFYEADEAQASLVIMVTDIPAGHAYDPQAALDAGVQSFQHDPEYTVLLTETTVLDGHVGRHMLYKLTTGERISHRSFIFGDRLYQSIAGLGPMAKAADIEIVERFEESLRFQPVATSAVAPALIGKLSAKTTPSAITAAPRLFSEDQCPMAAAAAMSAQQYTGNVNGQIPVGSRPAHSNLLDMALIEGCKTAGDFAARLTPSH